MAMANVKPSLASRLQGHGHLHSPKAQPASRRPHLQRPLAVLTFRRRPLRPLGEGARQRGTFEHRAVRPRWSATVGCPKAPRRRTLRDGALDIVVPAARIVHRVHCGLAAHGRTRPPFGEGFSGSTPACSRSCGSRRTVQQQIDSPGAAGAALGLFESLVGHLQAAEESLSRVRSAMEGAAMRENVAASLLRQADMAHAVEEAQRQGARTPS